MQTPQSELLADYHRHPSFSFGENAFQLNPLLAESFNESYLRARNAAPGSDPEEWTTAARQCVHALAEIFTALSGSAQDSMEKIFLDELHQATHRLLDTELEYIRRAAQAPSRVRGDKAKASEAARALKGQRYFFGKLPPEAVREIRRLAEPELKRFREAASNGKLTREDLSVGSGPAIAGIIGILNNSYAKQGVLAAVGDYAGCAMEVQGVALEMSVPQSEWWIDTDSRLARAPRTLYAHSDESIGHPKAIVYVSDVSEKNGPTTVYPGIYDSLNLTPLQELIGRIIWVVGSPPSSPLHAYYARRYHQPMSSERFRRHFMRLPDELRFNSHFGWDVLPDSAFERSMLERARPLLGEGGSYVVFDGARLIHRGGLIEQGERIVLQVIFSQKSEPTLLSALRARLRRLKEKLAWG